MDKPRIRINPKTGRPFHVNANGFGKYRFEIQVDGVMHRTIAYDTPYQAAYKAHTSDWYLTCR